MTGTAYTPNYVLLRARACVRESVCVRVRARARVCVCVCVCVMATLFENLK